MVVAGCSLGPPKGSRPLILGIDTPLPPPPKNCEPFLGPQLFIFCLRESNLVSRLGWWGGVENPQGIPRRKGAHAFFLGCCLGCRMDSGTGKRKWEEGQDPERGRWLRECDRPERSWPRGFPAQVPPCPALLLWGLACNSGLSSPPLPSPAVPFPCEQSRPVTPAPGQLSQLRPSRSGSSFPHLIQGKPQDWNFPPHTPYPLSPDKYARMLCTAQLLPWRWIEACEGRDTPIPCQCGWEGYSFL